MSGCVVSELVCVFIFSYGDQVIIDYMCVMLVVIFIELLLIKFYNLVYNVLVGYWIIVIGCYVVFIVVCVYMYFFGVGLLEVVSLVVVDQWLILLVCSDIVGSGLLVEVIGCM